MSWTLLLFCILQPWWKWQWWCISNDDAVFSPSASMFQAFFFFFFVSVAIGPAATPGILWQPRVIKKMIVEKQMECRLAGETQVLGENLPQRHFCPSQNPTWPDLGLNPGRHGWKSTTILFIYLFGLWGYWHCGHSWTIVPASCDSEDDCGEADGM
jgi:hypothetical protein